MYVCIYVYVRKHACMYMLTRLCARVSMCICKCLYVYVTRMCVCVCECVYMCLCARYLLYYIRDTEQYAVNI